MPVYEYQCAACSHAFEEWQKITEAAIKTCPKCGKDAVERLISQTAFMLKGGGWYKDLYSSSKSDGGTKSDTKSETKTETKSESKSDGGGGKSDSGSSSSSGASSSGSSGASTGSGTSAAK